jgi:hypothetical protein
LIKKLQNVLKNLVNVIFWLIIELCVPIENHSHLSKCNKFDYVLKIKSLSQVCPGRMLPGIIIRVKNAKVPNIKKYLRYQFKLGYLLSNLLMVPNIVFLFFKPEKNNKNFT